LRVLYGRDRERALLAGQLDAIRGGTATALVIRGEAGIGKSALIDSVVADALASGMRVLRTQGVESESPLAFAGLYQLLRPVLALLERLPAPQSQALRVAFGQQEGPVVEPFVAALATLAMLTEAAESTPALCVIEDAHWLDDASAEALLFAARRLQADPVALIFTVREGASRSFAADGVASLQLAGLDEEFGRAVLAEHVGHALSDAVVRALLDQAAGNPLALVELPTELTVEQLAGAVPPPSQLQLTDRLQRVFLDRCRRLPESVQTMLLVAAADDTGSLAVVQQAATTLGVPAEAVQDAECAKLIVTDRDTIQVRHPLVRSAVYQAATGHERRTAHKALATALSNHGDPDRQAWHLAAAADGRDPVVAAALEQAAERAERAAGYAAAAAAFERAADLTDVEALRAQRLFAAARNSWAGGHPVHAQQLAESAKAIADDRLLRADIDRLRARIEINVGSAVTAHLIFISAARAVAADDPTRALEMRVAATLTQLYSADVAHDPVSSVADSAPVEAPTASARTQCLQHLLVATTNDAAGQWELGLQALRAALDAAANVEDADVLGNLGNAALHLGDHEGHRRCFTHMLAGARDRGAVMSVLYALPRLAFADLLRGHWVRVRDAADEAIALCADTGQRPLAAAPLAWVTLLAAMQGNDRFAELHAQSKLAERQHLGVLTDPVHDMSRWAAGVHAGHAGDPVGSLHHLSRMRLTPLTRMAALDRFDAAVRAGDLSLAARWVEELAGFAAATGWSWAHATVAYGRALLADPADAAELFDTSIAHYETANRPYELARTHLAYGELLRRSQRRVDSRTHLRSALTVFEELGAEPLINLAAHELRASGETARKRDPSALTALTPMELQVAQLVAQGLSNKDAAAQLWISPRTVAFHLRGSFAKLGVSSRGELARLQLTESGAALAAAVSGR
jgi:DNA-binding CsgD family transcriptional regulator